MSTRPREERWKTALSLCIITICGCSVASWGSGVYRDCCVPNSASGERFQAWTSLDSFRQRLVVLLGLYLLVLWLIGKALSRTFLDALGREHGSLTADLKPLLAWLAYRKTVQGLHGPPPQEQILPVVGEDLSVRATNAPANAVSLTGLRWRRWRG